MGAVGTSPARRRSMAPRLSQTPARGSTHTAGALHSNHGCVAPFVLINVLSDYLNDFNELLKTRMKTVSGSLQEERFTTRRETSLYACTEEFF